MKRAIVILLALLTVSVFSNYELTELNEESHTQMYFSENSSNNSSAGGILPAVDLQCQSPNPSGAVDVPVYPGSSLTGYANCEVANPTSYTERIQIQVSADGLVVAAPGTITLGPGSESDFQVTVRADQRMTMSGHNLKVTATVVEANGAPPPNIAESEYSMIISILQFSRLQVEAVTTYVEMDAGSEITLEFKVYNQGNWADTFSISYENRDDTTGLAISSEVTKIEIESMAAPTTVELFVVAPDKSSNWTIGSDGEKYIYALVEFTAVSDFSCQFEVNGCNSGSHTVTIKIYQNQTATEFCSDEISSANTSVLIYGGIANVVFILLVLLVVSIIKKSEKPFSEIPPQKNYPSVEDVAQSFDDDGYEWIKLEDGASFYRHTGSKADWMKWEN